MRDIVMNVVVPQGLENKMIAAADGHQYKSFTFSVVITVKENGLLYAEHLYQVKVSLSRISDNIAIKVTDETNDEIMTNYISNSANSDKWIEPIMKAIPDSLLLFNKGRYCEE